MAGDDAAPLMAALAAAGPLQVARGAPGSAPRPAAAARRGGPPRAAPAPPARRRGGGGGRARPDRRRPRPGPRHRCRCPPAPRRRRARWNCRSRCANSVTRLDLRGPGAGAAGHGAAGRALPPPPRGAARRAGGGGGHAADGVVLLLDRALSPTAEIRRGTLDNLLARRLAVLRAGRPSAGRRAGGRGGDALRGGRRAAAALRRPAHSPSAATACCPCRCAPGSGRSAARSSWERPQTLAAFPEGSPFAGLVPPPEVTVTTQVLAEPIPRLAERSWARLSDGTPLVTFENRGAGRIVLFHVTANADWSDLPLVRACSSTCCDGWSRSPPASRARRARPPWRRSRRWTASAASAPRLRPRAPSPATAWTTPCPRAAQPAGLVRHRRARAGSAGR